MSEIITNEQELNTAIGDLITEDYALEILGLQSIADFRKFSRSFMKLSKIVKGIETNVDNNLDEKLNKGNVPDVLNSAEKIIKALQGNTGIKFDENLLYLNDAGTKNVGFCYLDRLTDGIFECIQETTTTVNNATYFKNFSNKENSDRLSNLCEVSIKSLGIYGNVKKLKYSDGTLIYQGILVFSELKTIEFDTLFVDKFISVSTIVPTSTENIVVSVSKLEKDTVTFISNHSPTFNFLITGRWK